jgi:DNA-binding NtrC family response regulator
LHIPPLASRRSDIALIAGHLVRELAEELCCAVPVIDHAALCELQSRDWPGNVRELRNALEHAMVVAEDSATIRVTDLPQPWNGSSAAISANAGDTEAEGFNEVIAAIRACGGQKAQAARLLNVSRTTLYRRLQRHGQSPVAP